MFLFPHLCSSIFKISSEIIERSIIFLKFPMVALNIMFMDKLVAESGMGRRKTWAWNTFRLNFRSAIFHFGKTKSSVSLRTELKHIFKALKCHKSFFHLKVLIAKASLAFDLLSFSYFDIVLLEKLLPRHRILKYCDNTGMEKKKRKNSH